MSKISSNHLFKLIRSMAKSEKRAFKVFANRLQPGEQKKFLLLFDAIDKQKNYDEAEILRKNPEIKRNQFANLKNNLYKQLLRTLVYLEQEKQPEMKITELIDQSRLLYNRCLYKESLLVADKAKKRAIKNDSKLLLLEILELEKLALRQNTGNFPEGRVKHLIAESESTSKSVTNINRFSNLALQLNSFYQKNGFIRNKKDLENVRSYFFDSLPGYEEKLLSFHEKLYLYYSYTGYYFFIQDFKEGYRYAKKWTQLFTELPEMIAHKTELYIKALNSLLVAQNKLGYYEEFSSTHKLLIAIKRNKALRLTENLNLHLFKAIYVHEINRHFLLGEFRSGTRIVKKLENELSGFIPKLDTHTVLIFYYKIGCLYFGAGNFREAIKWFNRIIYHEETEVREDLQSFARILRLVCYFETGDEDMLEYCIRTTYRYLLEKKSFINYQKLIMAFLKGLRKDYSKKEIVQRFKTLEQQMKQLEKEPYEKRAFIYFDIITWLKSKIENTPIQEIIKNKLMLLMKS